MNLFRSKLVILFILIISEVYSQEEMLPVGSNADEIVKRIELRDKNRIGTQLPIFIADALDGSVFNSIDTKKITLYYFWYNCGEPCVGLFPIFNEIQKEYNENVDFISITYQAKTQLLETLEEHLFNFRHCMMAENEIETLRLSIGYPTTIIAVDGIIIFCRSGGPMDIKVRHEWKEQFERIINENLK